MASVLPSLKPIDVAIAGTVTITIVNCGVGNLGSIPNMLKRLDAPARIASDTREIELAEKLILPGVGSFDAAVQHLRNERWIDILNRKVVVEKTPVLGICLGMQLLADASEEGELSGLGWIPGKVVRFRSELETGSLRIPHMGWNLVKVVRESPLFKGLEDEARFYFVHSYHFECTDPSDVVATTSYGCSFVSSLQRDNVMGVQFHPEKSHRFGLKLLENFVHI